MADADGGGGDGLHVQNARRAEVQLHAEALQRQTAQNLRLNAAHHPQAHVATITALYPQLRVLLLQHAQRLHKLRLRNLRPRVHRNLQQRFGAQRDVRAAARAQAVSWGHARQPREAYEVARSGLRNRQTAASVAQAQLARLEAARGRGDLLSRCEGAGEYLQIDCARAGIIVAKLVDTRGEGLGGVRVVVGVGDRIHGAQEAVDPLAGEGRAREGGEDAALRKRPRQPRAPGFEVVSALDESIQQRFVPLGDGFDGSFVHLRAVEAPEIRDLRGQQAAHGVEARVEVRIHTVALVHEDQRGHVVVLQQSPDGLRVALHALHAADDQHGEVQHRQHALHLRGEVHVPRRVQPVVAIRAQVHHRLVGKYGDAALPLHGMQVEKCVMMIHAPQAADCAAAVEYLLREGGLARVHVGEDADGLLHIRRSGRTCARRS